MEISFIILSCKPTVKNVCSKYVYFFNSSKYYNRNGKRNDSTFRKSVCCPAIYDEIGYIRNFLCYIPKIEGIFGLKEPFWVYREKSGSNTQLLRIFWVYGDKNFVYTQSRGYRVQVCSGSIQKHTNLKREFI